MAPVNHPNVGVAFALVIGAGLATALGASVVFFPRLVKLASRRVLAGALGLSAGVMTYVSFVEIFHKSTKSFEKGGETPEKAYLYATLCFFGGSGVMLILDFVVRLLSSKGSGHEHSHDHHHHMPSEAQRDDEIDEEGKGDGSTKANTANVAIPQRNAKNMEESKAEEELQGPHCIACSPDPVGDLEILQHQADEIIAQLDHGHYSHGHVTEGDGVDDEARSSKDDAAKAEEKKKLIKMGISTAIAIGLHNFPEGLATFVAALDDARVGAVLAIAIGIHNIPEGLCVALPVYYATGNRKQAFFWALLSGASEPFAALLGWAVLARSFSDHLFAALFGLVAGMMVIISIRELVPTAHRYDPDDTVVTYSFIGGMGIMALSLVLFVL